MKRFKKVLALVLAGVLALAMLTACGETADPDSIMPEDGTPEVVMTVNNMAANKGLGQVKYSAKYSAVTKALLRTGWSIPITRSITRPTGKITVRSLLNWAV